MDVGIFGQLMRPWQAAIDWDLVDPIVARFGRALTREKEGAVRGREAEDARQCEHGLRTGDTPSLLQIENRPVAYVAVSEKISSLENMDGCRASLEGDENPGVCTLTGFDNGQALRSIQGADGDLHTISLTTALARAMPRFCIARPGETLLQNDRF